jgi:hypothetical protein
MPRPYPNGRRRRPGRRPPNRYSGRHDPPARGFTFGGFDTFYRIFFPGLRGREKKAFFNEIASWMVLGFAIGGAMVGYSALGAVGVILGLGAGLAAGGSFAEKGGFYRR